MHAVHVINNSSRKSQKFKYKLYKRQSDASQRPWELIEENASEK